MDGLPIEVAAPLAFVLGGLTAWAVARVLRARGFRSAREEADRMVSEATQDADRVRKEAELAGKESVFRAKEAWERDEAELRREAKDVEGRLESRRGTLDRREESIARREEELSSQEHALAGKMDALRAQAEGLERQRGEVRGRLEKLAGLSAQDAKRHLIQEFEEEARAEGANRLREIRESAKRDADREARNIISLAIQRIAADHTAESTVSVVSLPSDEMKGRIIGREGRNIRAFEQATGIDVIIDDTPEAVILSGFDPIRRETARISLEKLITDGRIHPGRIEEVVAKSRKEVDGAMVEAAEEILYEMGVHGVHAEIVKVLGRLKYRTSYGQNQLLHSKEVAIVAGNMAMEMGLDATMAKRMGLLHDVGKGLTHDHEGTHVELGYRLCERHGEPEQVLNAIKAHHDEEPHRFPETFLVTAADAISGARPGARREMFETYVKRLEKLEEIAQGFDGVERCFAIQAGREIRVMVDPDNVTDEAMTRLSDQVARKLEDELQYPGQIKVVVIRETRAVDFAR
ncbi:MAG: ribonuclease Y [Gemmatimonadota bacterium]